MPGRNLHWGFSLPIIIMAMVAVALNINTPISFSELHKPLPDDTLRTLANSYTTSRVSAPHYFKDFYTAQTLITTQAALDAVPISANTLTRDSRLEAVQLIPQPPVVIAETATCEALVAQALAALRLRDGGTLYFLTGDAVDMAVVLLPLCRADYIVLPQTQLESLP